MHSHYRAIVCLAAILSLGSCSENPAAPTEQGPFVLDFEGSPDDGFAVVAPPVSLGSGITVEDILPAGDFYDFKTADAWGVGCGATAHSGNFMIGFYNSGSVHTAVITFATPVSRVTLYGGTSAGSTLTVTAYDAQDVVVDQDQTTSACPTLDTNDFLSVAAGSNRIVLIEITGGSAPVVDDLAYYRFQ